MPEATTAAEKPSKRIEIVAVVMLAIAAVATAWCSYQANRWNGERISASGRSTSLRSQAERAEALAEAQSVVDVQTFIQWVDARTLGRSDLQQFYEDRFREEFRPAFDAWLATAPFENADAPPTPFAMPEYELGATAEAEQYDAQTERESARSRAAIQRGANYMLAVVLFALVLFFAGISTKLGTPRLRRVLLGVGCGLFIVTLAWVATFPVRFSI